MAMLQAFILRILLVIMVEFLGGGVLFLKNMGILIKLQKYGKDWGTGNCIGQG